MFFAFLVKKRKYFLVKKNLIFNIFEVSHPGHLVILGPNQGLLDQGLVDGHLVILAPTRVRPQTQHAPRQRCQVQDPEGVGGVPRGAHERHEQNAGPQHPALDLVHLQPPLPHRVPPVSAF